MKKILLDAREMEHPKPFEISIKHLQTMKENSYLYMLNQKVPTPLLDLAKERGFNYVTKQDKKEDWHIIISRNNVTNLEELLDV